MQERDSQLAKKLNRLSEMRCTGELTKLEYEAALWSVLRQDHDRRQCVRSTITDD